MSSSQFMTTCILSWWLDEQTRATKETSLPNTIPPLQVWLLCKNTRIALFVREGVGDGVQVPTEITRLLSKLVSYTGIYFRNFIFQILCRLTTRGRFEPNLAARVGEMLKGRNCGQFLIIYSCLFANP